jgi:hypothetical protein
LFVRFTRRLELERDVGLGRRVAILKLAVFNLEARDERQFGRAREFPIPVPWSLRSSPTLGLDK